MNNSPKERVEPTKYILRENFIGGYSQEIDQVSFQKISEARRGLIAIKDFEDLFSLIGNALLEIEHHSQLEATRYSLGAFSRDNIHEFFDAFRDNYNLKIINLLNAAKAFEDQSKRRCKDLIPFNPDIESVVSKSFSSAFDQSLSYRVMYAMRNAAQHHQLPLDGFSIGTKPTPHTINGDVLSMHRQTIDPYFLTDSLVNNREIRASTRTELSDLNQKNLDAKSLVRGYCTQLFLILKKMRESSEVAMNVCQETLTEAQNLATAKGKKRNTAPICIEAWDHKEALTKVHISQSIFQSLENKRARWMGMSRLQITYVSSQISDAKETEFDVPLPIKPDSSESTNQ
jgi:hypothetical protein